MLSGIQHFYFCKRQWALIDIEACWKDDEATQEGRLLHEKADNPFLKESRPNKFYSRSIPVASHTLGFSGILDVVEFEKAEDGIPIEGKKGLWRPHIVEYKRGKEKKDLCDIMQLAAEVICLEESLNVSMNRASVMPSRASVVPSASIYYFASKKRMTIDITDELRSSVQTAADEMHTLYRDKKTPPAEPGKHCTRCSLCDICLPKLTLKKTAVQRYLLNRIADNVIEDNIIEDNL